MPVDWSQFKPIPEEPKTTPAVDWSKFTPISTPKPGMLDKVGDVLGKNVIQPGMEAVGLGNYSDVPAEFVKEASLGYINPAITPPTETPGIGHTIAKSAAGILGFGTSLIPATMAAPETAGMSVLPAMARMAGIGAARGFLKHPEDGQSRLGNALEEGATLGAFEGAGKGLSKIASSVLPKEVAPYISSSALMAGAGALQPAQDINERLQNTAVGAGTGLVTHSIADIIRGGTKKVSQLATPGDVVPKSKLDNALQDIPLKTGVPIDNTTGEPLVTIPPSPYDAINDRRGMDKGFDSVIPGFLQAAEDRVATMGGITPNIELTPEQKLIDSDGGMLSKKEPKPLKMNIALQKMGIDNIPQDQEPPFTTTERTNTVPTEQLKQTADDLKETNRGIVSNMIYKPKDQWTDTDNSLFEQLTPKTQDKLTSLQQTGLMKPEHLRAYKDVLNEVQGLKTFANPQDLLNVQKLTDDQLAASKKNEFDQKAHEASTSPLNTLSQPTDSQKESGNYKKGHAAFQGLDLSIENPQGSTRSGISPNGQPWETTLQNHYGYIRGVKGNDKDHLDFFMGDNPSSQKVFVVNQNNPETGKFDEHKAMFGFNTKAEAEVAYRGNYHEGWNGLGSITPMEMKDFKRWTQEGNIKSPAENPNLTDFRKEIWAKAVPSDIRLNFVSDVARGVGNLDRGLAEHGISVNDTKDYTVTGHTKIVSITPEGVKASVNIANNLSNPETLRVIAHEQAHVLEAVMKSLGKDKELAILHDKFKDMTNLDGTIKKKPEVLADAYADFVAGKKALIPKPLHTLFDKVTNFFERVGNWFKDRGFKSAEDVFGEMEAGKYKQEYDNWTQIYRDDVNYKTLEQLAISRPGEDEKKPMIERIANVFKSYGDEIKSLFAPALRGPNAQWAAGAIREGQAGVIQNHDQAVKAVEAGRGLLEKLGKEFGQDMWDAMELKDDNARKLALDALDQRLPEGSPKVSQLADLMQGSLNTLAKKIQDLGTGKLDELVKNYFPHAYKNFDKAQQFFGGKIGSKSFTRERLIETMAEARTHVDKEGNLLEPLYDNPVDMYAHRMMDMNRFLMWESFKKEAKGTANKLDSNLTMLTLVKGKNTMPEGYEPIDERIGKVSYRNDDNALVEGGRYYAPKEVAGLINNYLSPGLRGSKMFRDYIGLSNVMNQFQLGLSFFHLGFTSIDSIISEVGRGFIQLSRRQVGEGLQTILRSPIAPLDTILKGDKLFKEWFAPGTQGEVMGDVLKAVVSGGGRARMDSFYRTDVTESFTRALRDGDYLKGALKAPFALVEQTAKPIMEYLVPRQKLGVFMNRAKMEIERNPDMSAEQAREVFGKIWDSVDNRMGQLVYDNLFWNKTVKDLGMASVRSLGWNLGSFREIPGGVKDLVTQMNNLRKGGTPELTDRMAYTMALPIVVGMMGGMTQYLLTGQGPQEDKDYFFPKTGGTDENGHPERVSLPSYVKDLVHYYNAPGQTLKNKMHPALSMVGEMLGNKDFYGTKIRNEDDDVMVQAMDLAKHVGKSFVPFAGRGIAKEIKLQGEVTPKALLPFVGITPAPADITKTPAERLAGQLAQTHIPTETGRTKEQRERYELKKSLERGLKLDPEATTSKLQEALQQGKLSKIDMQQIIKARHETPLQTSFNTLSVKEALKVWEEATPEERVKLRPLLVKKMSNTKSITPEERPVLLEKVRKVLTES